MHGVVRLFLLTTLAAAADGASARSNAWRARTRLSAGASGLFDMPTIYASEGELSPIVYPSDDPKPQAYSELLRFVTAYKKGIEAFVDITPYSPLLRATADTNNKVSVYTFIDTWVNNNSLSDVLYMSNTSGKCHLLNMSQGNGWGLTASLIFWPRDNETVSTLPRDTVTIVSGLGNDILYPIGRVGFHKANVSENGSAVLLEKELDFSTIKSAKVYDMPAEREGMAALLGYVAAQTEVFTRNADTDGLGALLNNTFESLLYEGLFELNVTDVDNESSTLQGVYNGTELQWEVGMPVYFNGGDVMTDHQMGKWWMNVSVPMEPVGKVILADGENITVELTNNCLPTNFTKGLPHLLIPHSKKVLPKVRAIIYHAQAQGIKAATEFTEVTRERNLEPRFLVLSETKESLPDQDARLPDEEVRDCIEATDCRTGEQCIEEACMPSEADEDEDDDESEHAPADPHCTKYADEAFRSHDQAAYDTIMKVPCDDRRVQYEMIKAMSVASPTVLGQADLLAAGGGDATEDTWQRLLLETPIGEDQSNVTDGQTVLVLTQERHGLLFKKDFELSHLTFGDKVVLQLAVTGHGWSATAEQCGEYCHAVYRLRLNGRVAANVTQFRDDCHLNPISHQYGTWDESRNGWCPGTVVPGIFMDVTDHVRRGNNTMAVDLFVWSNVTLKYEPYSDYAGFIFNDQAVLAVGMTAMVYNRTAVRAILKQHQAFTAAEAAIRNGSSAPERLKPPTFVTEPSENQVFLQVGSRAVASRWKKESRHQSVRLQRFGEMNGHPQERAFFMDKHIHRSKVPMDISNFPSSALQGEKLDPPHALPSLMRAEGHPSTSKHHREIHHHHRTTGHHHRAARHHHSSMGVDVQRSFDFEERAPWYLYNSTEEGSIDVTGGALKKVALWTDQLMQGSKREVRMEIDKDSLPIEWDRVALHFHLHDPPGDLEMDHWDRMGSVGLRFGTS